MLNAIRRIEPSTIQVSHQMVTLELNRVSQPAPVDAAVNDPGVEIRTRGAAALGEAIDEQGVVDLVDEVLVVEKAVQAGTQPFLHRVSLARTVEHRLREEDAGERQSDGRRHEQPFHARSMMLARAQRSRHGDGRLEVVLERGDVQPDISEGRGRRDPPAEDAQHRQCDQRDRHRARRFVDVDAGVHPVVAEET